MDREKRREEIAKVVEDRIRNPGYVAWDELALDTADQILALFDGDVIEGIEVETLVTIMDPNNGPDQDIEMRPIPVSAAGEIIITQTKALTLLLNHLKLPEFYKLEIEEALTYNGERLMVTEDTDGQKTGK